MFVVNINCPCVTLRLPQTNDVGRTIAGLGNAPACTAPEPRHLFAYWRSFVCVCESRMIKTRATRHVRCSIFALTLNLVFGFLLTFFMGREEPAALESTIHILFQVMDRLGIRRHNRASIAVFIPSAPRSGLPDDGSHDESAGSWCSIPATFAGPS